MQGTSAQHHSGRRLPYLLQGLVAVLFSTLVGAGCGSSHDRDTEISSIVTGPLSALVVTELPRPLEPITKPSLTASVVHDSLNGILQGYLSVQGDAVIQTTQGTYRLEYGTWALTALPESIRWLTAIVSLESLGTVLFDLQGVHILQDGSLDTSPIGQWVDPAMIAAGHWFDDQLWLLNGDEITLWEDDSLYTISWPDLLASVEDMKPGACLGHEEGLWLRGDSTGCLVLTDPDLTLHIYHHEAVDAFEVTSEASYILQHGQLYRKGNGDPSWKEVVLPGRLTQLLGHPLHEKLWMRDSAGWWILDGLERRQVVGVEPSTVLIGLGPQGVAQGYSENSWTRITPGPVIDIAPLNPGETLYLDREVSFNLSSPENVLEWTVSLDGDIMQTGPQNSYMIEAEGLPPGDHVLSVSALIPGSEINPATSLPFIVARIPGWKEDIQPIYAEKCSLCHDPGVTTFPLHTAELWKYNMEEIELAMELDVMPLLPITPLTVEQKDLITVWKQYDFQP